MIENQAYRRVLYKSVFLFIPPGWGTTSSGFPTSRLKAAEVDLIDMKACKTALPKYGIAVESDGDVCAGGEGEPDACQ